MTVADDVEQERTTLAGVYADLGARIEELEQSKAGVRARLLELGSGPAGMLRVYVNPVRRLNVERFTERFPAADFPALWEEKPRAAAVKGLGQDDLYDQGAVQLRVVDADS